MADLIENCSEVIKRKRNSYGVRLQSDLFSQLLPTSTFNMLTDDKQLSLDITRLE